MFWTWFMPVCCPACWTKLQQHISWKVLAIISLQSCQCWISSRHSFNEFLPPNHTLQFYGNYVHLQFATWEPRSHHALGSMPAQCLFFGFLISGKVTSPKHQFDERPHLAFGDITLDSRSSPKLVKVKIKASKTDPLRQGVSNILGCEFNTWISCSGGDQGWVSQQYFGVHTWVMAELAY